MLPVERKERRRLEKSTIFQCNLFTWNINIMATSKSAWINNFGLYFSMALLCLSCTSIVLKQGQPLSTIAFSIEITDEDQKVAADSLGGFNCAQRL